MTIDARLRALVGYGLAWVLISMVTLAVPAGSLRRRQGWLDRLAARLPEPPPFTPGEAAWAVTAAARRVPGARCLAWSLALRGLFAQAKVQTELRIGVAASGPGAIRAHAWVEAAGQTWSWGDPSRYRVLLPRPAQT
jgi:hypothetical protein